MLNQTVSEQSLVSTSKSIQIDALRLDLTEIQAKHEEKLNKLQKAMEKLNRMSC